MSKVINKKLTIPLTDKRRELMHLVMDGDNELVGVMHVMHGYKYCDNFLTWLVHHRYVGKNLRDLIINKFGSSVPAMINYIVEQIGESKLNARKES